MAELTDTLYLPNGDKRFVARVCTGGWIGLNNLLGVFQAVRNIAYPEEIGTALIITLADMLHDTEASTAEECMQMMADAGLLQEYIDWYHVTDYSK